MRWYMTTGVVVLGAALVVAGEKFTLRFGADDVGKTPAGWKVARTGPGEGSVWKVVADATAPSGKGHALAQSAAGPTRLFNLCMAADTNFKDGEVRVQFKAVQGKIDQGGGVVWRSRDADNYYVCRYNPLEENVRLYKVVQGKRLQLATREGLDLPAGRWHDLAIRHHGDRIECQLNGKTYLEIRDATFPEAGKVGLWTKADAVTYFDALTIITRE